MADETTSPAPQGANGSPSSDAIDDAAVLNGGIDIAVEKIDGSSEEVKVRQLPIRLIDQWGNAQGDEAYLVELLCDRLDTSNDFHLRNARATELRLLQLLQSTPLEQIDVLDKRLKAIRAEIDALEKKPRWSDSLTEQAIVRIRDLGEQLNKKKFGRWAARTSEAVKRMTSEAVGSPGGKSSSPSASS